MAAKSGIRLLFALAGISFLGGCGKAGKTDQSPEANSSVVVQSTNPAEVEQPAADEKPLQVSAGTNAPDPAAEDKRVDRLQQDLISAVTQGDLEKSRECLASGAKPDLAQDTNATPLSIAGLLASRSEQTGDNKAMEIFLELCRHIRHRDATRVEMEGRFVVQFTPTETKILEIEPADGEGHPVSISMAETRYINTAPADDHLGIKFERRYRVAGYETPAHVIEVEEIELIDAPPPPVGRTTTGWDWPIPLLLGSTDAQLSFSLLASSGWTTVGPITYWEYKIVPSGDSKFSFLPPTDWAPKQAMLLDSLDKDGWRLITESNGYFYLRRPAR
jgi:hypothetical protein